MESIANMYIKGVKSKLMNYYAAWLPNETLALGDVGRLEKNLFTRVTSLSELGITFQTRDDPHPSPIDMVSSSEVSFELKLAGQTNPNLPSIPEAKAGIGLEFGKKGAFVVKAAQSYTPSIENIAKVQKDILELVDNGTWKRKWAVITKSVDTPKATIIISNSSSSKISLQAESDVAVSELDLGNANLSFSVTSQKGDIIKIIGAENISPFFQLSGIKRSFFHGDTIKPLSLRMPNPLFDTGPSPNFSVHDKQEGAPYLDLILDSDEW